MAEPILLDRFRESSYSQAQLTNDKLDFLIAEIRDMKQNIRVLDEKIDQTRKELKSEISATRAELKSEIDKNRIELKSEIDNLDQKIEDVRKELKDEISDVRKELKNEIIDASKDFKAEVQTSRWQIISVVVAQLCSVCAIVWAVVSAVK